MRAIRLILALVLAGMATASLGETLVTQARILEVTERGFLLMVGTEPLAVEDTPETKCWRGLSSAERDAFKKDETVHVRVKTDADPPILREIADPQTARWLDDIRKTARKGTVDKLDSKFLTVKFVDGTSFRYRITDKSDIRLAGKPEASMADLRQGMTIWVRSRLLPSLDTWVVEISDSAPPAKEEKKPEKSSKPAQAKPLPGIGTLTGEVVAVLGTYKMIDITVSGRLLHITVNASTAFMKDGKPATFTMVERGQRITVSYKRDKNGRIIAVRVDLP